MTKFNAKDIYKSELQAKRFVDKINEIMIPSRQQKLNKLEPAKIRFYLIYATTKHENSDNFEKLIHYIKIYGQADIDRGLTNLIEYMINHRDHCRRYEEINLATLKLALNALKYIS